MKYRCVRDKTVVVDAIQIVRPMTLGESKLYQGRPGDYLVIWDDDVSQFFSPLQFECDFRPVNAVEVPIITSGLAKLEHARDVAKELRDLLREIAL